MNCNEFLKKSRKITGCFHNLRRVRKDKETREIYYYNPETKEFYLLDEVPRKKAYKNYVKKYFDDINLIKRKIKEIKNKELINKKKLKGGLEKWKAK